MEKKNDRNKSTSQNKLYSDEIKEMERLSEEQEKALRERRQARKHRIKKQERRKKMIVLGSMAVVTVVVAVSCLLYTSSGRGTVISVYCDKDRIPGWSGAVSVRREDGICLLYTSRCV